MAPAQRSGVWLCLWHCVSALSWYVGSYEHWKKDDKPHLMVHLSCTLLFLNLLQKTFKDEELLPLQLVLKKLDLISELSER